MSGSIQSIARSGVRLFAVIVVPVFCVYHLAMPVAADGDAAGEGWRHGPFGLERPTPGVNVKGSVACKECHFHENAGKAHLASTHGTSFKTRHKSQEARTIRDKLKAGNVEGVSRSMKSSARCVQCHYSGIVSASGKFSAKEGVSCESCHGPSQHWFEQHNDYGAVTAAEETAAHRNARIEGSVKAGMIRPDAYYLLARNCLLCHVVDDEELVNIGGHSIGSDFELVAWSQGEVRHNFTKVENGLKEAGTVNKEAPLETKRILFAVGATVDLARSLEGLSKAKDANGSYAKGMKERITSSLGKLQPLASAVPGLAGLVEKVSGADLASADLKALALETSEVAKSIAATDPGQLAGVDAHLPASDAYKGTPFSP